VRKTSTIYTCDGCKTKLERPRDLRVFEIHPKGEYRYAVRVEVCNACEMKLLTALKEFASDDGAVNLDSFRRETKP